MTPDEVLAELDAFRAKCEAAEYTDTGEAWEMIDKLEDALRATLPGEPDWLKVPCPYCGHKEPGLPCTLYGNPNGKPLTRPHRMRLRG